MITVFFKNRQWKTAWFMDVRWEQGRVAVSPSLHGRFHNVTFHGTQDLYNPLLSIQCALQSPRSIWSSFLVINSLLGMINLTWRSTPEINIMMFYDFYSLLHICVSYVFCVYLLTIWQQRIARTDPLASESRWLTLGTKKYVGWLRYSITRVVCHQLWRFL